MMEVVNPPHSHYLQHSEWAAVRAKYDWQSRSLQLATTAGEQPVTVYNRAIKPIGMLAYIPYCLPVFGGSQVKNNLERLREGLADCFAVTIEPQQLASSVDGPDLEALGLKRLWPAGIQNISTVIVDLNRPEEEIFASFTKEKRYNVRKAERRGVVVREVPTDQSGFDLVYSFKLETIGRSDHYYRPKQFIYDVWGSFAEAGKARIFVAEHDGQPVSAVLVLHDDYQAWSRDSGSLREANSLGAPSLMQWEAMKAIRGLGIKRYDLCGIRPPGQREPSNPRYGIFRFKSGFSEAGIEDYCGPYDLVINKPKYELWKRTRGLHMKITQKRTQNYFF